MELPKLHYEVVPTQGGTRSALVFSDCTEGSWKQAQVLMHRIETWPELVSMLQGFLDTMKEGSLSEVDNFITLEQLEKLLSRAEKGE